LLAVVIAALLAGAVVAAFVKDGSSKVVVAEPTPTPTQTYTYPGVPPTAAATETETEEPVIPPSETPEASPTSTRLANTGSGSTTGAAFVVLVLALVGGFGIARAARGSP
jgi:hypothetical protein